MFDMFNIWGSDNKLSGLKSYYMSTIATSCILSMPEASVFSAGLSKLLSCLGMHAWLEDNLLSE